MVRLMFARMIGGCLDCLLNIVGTRYDKTAEFVERYCEDGFCGSWRLCLNSEALIRGLWQNLRRQAGLGML